MLGADPIRVHPVTLLAPPMVSDLTRSDPGINVFGARPRFLFVGRLVKAKNAGILLEASRILKDEGMAFSFASQVAGRTLLSYPGVHWSWG